MKYAVLRYKNIDGVRHLSLDTIFDYESKANDYCKLMNEHCSVREHYTVQSVKLCSKVVDDDIIKRCYNIANGLEIAEREFLKRGSGSYDKAKFWFDEIHARCKIAANLIDCLYV